VSIGAAIERMDERLDALAQALIPALPTHTIKRSLLDYRQHEEAELLSGVVTIVSAGERNYSNALGMAAREGTQRVLLVGHLQVAQASAPADIEAAELDLIEEIKACVRSGINGMSVRLDSVEHSRQLEHPYGWVVAHLDLGPPRTLRYVRRIPHDGAACARRTRARIDGAPGAPNEGKLNA